MKKRHTLPIAFMAMTVWIGLLRPVAADDLGEPPPRYQLDLIVTTAQRESEGFFYTVDELLAKDLEERDVQTVAQAMNYLPGIRTKIARVGHGKYLYLRGFEQQHLLILVDGVPLYNPYDGLVELDHIPSENIQAIRVVKGPSSAAYGPNALGGVIHIITKNALSRPNRGMVAEFGPNGTSNLRFHNDFQRGPLYVRFSGSRARSDGHRLSGNFCETQVPNLPDGQSLLHYENGGLRDNSDYAKNAGHLTLSYLSSERFHLAISGSLVDNEWGIPPHPFYNAKKNKTRIRYWRFTQWRQGMANLTAAGRISERLSARAVAFFNKYDNTLDSYDDETYTSQQMGYAFHSIYDDRAIGGHMHVEGRLGSMGNLTMGGGLIQDVHRDTPDRGDPTSEFELRTWWVWTEDKVKLSERISGVVGFNYALLDKRKAGDLGNVDDELAALNPHICLACLISPTSRAYLSLALLTRFPTMKQLYGTDGNPQLKAQKTNHLELGTEWAPSSRAHLRGALFYDGVQDLIEGNFLSPTTVNVEKAHLYGGELSLHGTPRRGLQVFLGYAYLRTQNRSPDRPGEYLQYRPEHKLDWNISAQIPYGLKILFYGSALSRQFFYDDFQERRLRHLPSCAVGNLSLRQEFSPHLEPFLVISNLFDVAYQDVYTSPAPGREIRGGLRLSW